MLLNMFIDLLLLLGIIILGVVTIGLVGLIALGIAAVIAGAKEAFTETKKKVQEEGKEE